MSRNNIESALNTRKPHPMQAKRPNGNAPKSVLLLLRLPAFFQTLCARVCGVCTAPAPRRKCALHSAYLYYIYDMNTAASRRPGTGNRCVIPTTVHRSLQSINTNTNACCIRRTRCQCVCMCVLVCCWACVYLYIIVSAAFHFHPIAAAFMDTFPFGISS